MDKIGRHEISYSPEQPSEHSVSDISLRQYSHLPTPQSPRTVGQYVNIPYPESPLSGASLQISAAQRQSYRSLSEDLAFRSPPKTQQQILTPESSPPFPRDVHTPRASLGPSFNSPMPTSQGTITSNFPLEFPTSLAPAHLISTASNMPTPENNADVGLPSPFINTFSFADRPNPAPSSESPQTTPNSSEPLQLDDVFSSMPISTPPHSPLSKGGEIERIRLQMMQSKIAHFQEAESRRPEYLKRAKRSRLESDHLVNEGRVSEETEENEPGPVGITATPNRGRRLKLFQETSEESFEESLMAGGYGRYRTADWLKSPQPGPSFARPSSVVPSLETDSPPGPKELKKLKRLAAFRDLPVAVEPVPVSKLSAVEIQGKGRVLFDTVIDETGLVKETLHVKKRRNKRSAAADLSSRESVSEPDRPNWPDLEFPWRLRFEEREYITRAEEADRLRWIEKFLDRDSDEEEEDADDSSPIASRDVACDNPAATSRRGRGKMIPLMTNPTGSTSPLQRPRTFFPSDPADARAALMSKKSVRSFSYGKERRDRRKGGNGHDESEVEAICICRGRDEGPELVQCDNCQTWYHLQCIGIGSIAELGREEDPWYCHRCPPASARTMSPGFAPSHEPAFVQIDDELPANSSDPFFQSATWSSHSPMTPMRRGQIDSGFSSGSSWNESSNGPSTPRKHPHVVGANLTPSVFDNRDEDHQPFDPTSTPSRGIKFSTSAATPKQNVWPFRANSALFQTPKYSRPTTNRVLGADLPSSSTSDDPFSSFNAYRSLPFYDESPTRRTKSGDRESTNISERALLR